MFLFMCVPFILFLNCTLEIRIVKMTMNKVTYVHYGIFDRSEKLSKIILDVSAV